MDESVFDLFTTSSYTFLQISRGGVYGNRILTSTNADGVFKLRSGMVMINNQESRQSDATLHIRPTESFIATVGGLLVGHGILKDGQHYEIIGATGGDNFHTGKREHYRLTLQIADFADTGESS